MGVRCFQKTSKGDGCGDGIEKERWGWEGGVEVAFFLFFGFLSFSSIFVPSKSCLEVRIRGNSGKTWRAAANASELERG